MEPMTMTVNFQFFSIYKFFHFSAINDAMDLEIFGMDLEFREDIMESNFSQ